MGPSSGGLAAAPDSASSSLPCSSEQVAGSPASRCREGEDSRLSKRTGYRRLEWHFWGPDLPHYSACGGTWTAWRPPPRGLFWGACGQMLGTFAAGSSRQEA